MCTPLFVSKRPAEIVFATILNWFFDLIFIFKSSKPMSRMSPLFNKSKIFFRYKQKFLFLVISIFEFFL